MERQYNAKDVIELPCVSASSAMALGEALLSAAREHRVPKAAQRAHQRLKSSHGALTAALITEATPRTGNPEAVRAGRAVDTAWSALHLWLSGWAKHTELPEGQRAAQALTVIYPEGLGFTQLPYVEEWSESEVRLQRLPGEVEGTVRELGGAPFLQQVRRAHRAYGEALRITAAGEGTAPSAPAKRVHLDAFLASLRGYVLKVSSHADEDDVASQELVAKLLRPLTEFRSRARETGVVAPADPVPVEPTPKA